MVSVIIPVYNAENTIERAIFSIINQTYVDWELIIVDDCSTDKTSDICDRYASMYKNIHVIHNETNLGAGESRYIGFQNSIGDFITFLDSDDIFLSTLLYMLVEHQKIENSDIVYSSYTNIYEDGRQEPINILDLNYNGENTIMIYETINGKKFVGNLYRREILDKIKDKWCKNRIAEDIQMLFYSLYNSNQVRAISYIGYMRNVHDGSLLCNKPELFNCLLSLSVSIDVCDFIYNEEVLKKNKNIIFRRLFLKDILYTYDYCLSINNDENRISDEIYHYDELFDKARKWINEKKHILNFKVEL